MRDRASVSIGREHGVPERCLMKSRLHLAERIPALRCVGWHSLSRGPHGRSESKLDPYSLWMPADDECRDDALIATGRSAEKIDDRDLLLHRIQKPAVIR